MSFPVPPPPRCEDGDGARAPPAYGEELGAPKYLYHPPQHSPVGPYDATRTPPSLSTRPGAAAGRHPSSNAYGPLSPPPPHPQRYRSSLPLPPPMRSLRQSPGSITTAGTTALALPLDRRRVDSCAHLGLPVTLRSGMGAAGGTRASSCVSAASLDAWAPRGPCEPLRWSRVGLGDPHRGRRRGHVPLTPPLSPPPEGDGATGAASTSDRPSTPQSQRIPAMVPPSFDAYNVGGHEDGGAAATRELYAHPTPHRQAGKGIAALYAPLPTQQQLLGRRRRSSPEERAFQALSGTPTHSKSPRLAAPERDAISYRQCETVDFQRARALSPTSWAADRRGPALPTTTTHTSPTAPTTLCTIMTAPPQYLDVTTDSLRPLTSTSTGEWQSPSRGVAPSSPSPSLSPQQQHRPCARASSGVQHSRSAFVLTGDSNAADVFSSPMPRSLYPAYACSSPSLRMEDASTMLEEQCSTPRDVNIVRCTQRSGATVATAAAAATTTPEAAAVVRGFGIGSSTPITLWSPARAAATHDPTRAWPQSATSVSATPAVVAEAVRQVGVSHARDAPIVDEAHQEEDGSAITADHEADLRTASASAHLFYQRNADFLYAVDAAGSCEYGGATEAIREAYIAAAVRAADQEVGTALPPPTSCHASAAFPPSTMTLLCSPYCSPQQLHVCHGGDDDDDDDRNEWVDQTSARMVAFGESTSSSLASPQQQQHRRPAPPAVTLALRRSTTAEAIAAAATNSAEGWRSPLQWNPHQDRDDMEMESVKYVARIAIAQAAAAVPSSSSLSIEATGLSDAISSTRNRVDDKEKAAGAVKEVTEQNAAWQSWGDVEEALSPRVPSLWTSISPLQSSYTGGVAKRVGKDKEEEEEGEEEEAEAEWMELLLHFRDRENEGSRIRKALAEAPTTTTTAPELAESPVGGMPSSSVDSPYSLVWWSTSKLVLEGIASHLVSRRQPPPSSPSRSGGPVTLPSIASVPADNTPLHRSMSASLASHTISRLVRWRAWQRRSGRRRRVASSMAARIPRRMPLSA